MFKSLSLLNCHLFSNINLKLLLTVIHAFFERMFCLFSICIWLALQIIVNKSNNVSTYETWDLIDDYYHCILAADSNNRKQFPVHATWNKLYQYNYYAMYTCTLWAFWKYRSVWSPGGNIVGTHYIWKLIEICSVLVL